MQEKTLNDGKLEAVELSDDALEGVSGGMNDVLKRINELADLSGGFQSTPLNPGAHEGIYINRDNTCSFYKSKRLSSSDPHICVSCRYFDDVPADGGGYCMRTCS